MKNAHLTKTWERDKAGFLSIFFLKKRYSAQYHFQKDIVTSHAENRTERKIGTYLPLLITCPVSWALHFIFLYLNVSICKTVIISFLQGNCEKQIHKSAFTPSDELYIWTNNPASNPFVKNVPVGCNSLIKHISK